MKRVVITGGAVFIGSNLAEELAASNDVIIIDDLSTGEGNIAELIKKDSVGEYYCHIFHEIYDLPTICLRYFNVYESQQSLDLQYAAVIPIFIARVSQNKHPIIYGDGEQTRDFTFIKDVIKANIIGAESDACGVFNIGRSEKSTINDLARTTIDLMGKDLKSEYQPPRPGDIKHSLADISKARAIGYEPQYSLDNGLRETIKRLTSAS